MRGCGGPEGTKQKHLTGVDTITGSVPGGDYRPGSLSAGDDLVLRRGTRAGPIGRGTLPRPARAAESLSARILKTRVGPGGGGGITARRSFCQWTGARRRDPPEGGERGARASQDEMGQRNRAVAYQFAARHRKRDPRCSFYGIRGGAGSTAGVLPTTFGGGISYPDLKFPFFTLAGHGFRAPG